MALGGPTVRRLHRERQARAAGAPGLRERQGESASAGAAPAPYAVAREPSTRATRSAGSGFPFNVASLLATDRFGNVAVLDDEILHLTWREPRQGEDWAEVSNQRLAIQNGGSLRRRLEQACEEHGEAVVEWVRRHSPKSSGGGLDAGRDMPDTAREVETFVLDELIPALREAASGGEAPPRGLQAVDPAAGPPTGKGPGSRTPAPDVELDGGKWWAYFGECWFQLVPYFGRRTPGRFRLQLGERAYVERSRLKRSCMMERQERRLQRAMVEALGPSVDRGEEVSRLYDDGEHAVLLTPQGRYWMCRRVPPYAVEGPNRRIYRFDGAEVGIWISSVDPARVLHEASACIVHPYAHMFVLGGGAGAPICMPRPQDYYRRLQRLPLAEGLRRHLESARMTLCAGLFHNNLSSPYMPVDAVARGTIRASEARQLGIPIYRYYRN
ncbi:hypothetical protein ACFL6X_06225 [Candidatus Latescibacterota bacterium]